MRFDFLLILSMKLTPNCVPGEFGERVCRDELQLQQLYELFTQNEAFVRFKWTTTF